MTFPERIWFVVNETVGVWVFLPFFVVAAGSGCNSPLSNGGHVSRVSILSGVFEMI